MPPLQWALFEADVDPVRGSEQQVRTISKERLGRRLGSLDDAILRQAVREAMREHLDLE